MVAAASAAAAQAAMGAMDTGISRILWSQSTSQLEWGSTTALMHMKHSERLDCCS